MNERSGEEQGGWLPAEASLVVVYVGEHLNLLPNRSDIEMVVGGPVEPDRDPSGTQYAFLGGFIRRDGLLGVRTERTRAPSSDTRVQVRAVGPKRAELREMALVMRRLIDGIQEKPQSAGINFGRIFLESDRFHVNAFLKRTAGASGLSQILRGRDRRTREMVVVSHGEGEQTQLRLRSVTGEGPFGEFEGIVFDVNFTAPATTQRALRSAVGPRRAERKRQEFDRILRRIERRLHAD